VILALVDLFLPIEDMGIGWGR